MPRRAHQYGEHDAGMPDEADRRVPDEPMPSDAETLEDTIDRRMKALLTMASEPKDLTAALKVAIEWAKEKRESQATDGWGEQLKRGTVHEG